MAAGAAIRRHCCRSKSGSRQAVPRSEVSAKRGGSIAPARGTFPRLNSFGATGDPCTGSQIPAIRVVFRCCTASDCALYFAWRKNDGARFCFRVVPRSSGCGEMRARCLCFHIDAFGFQEDCWARSVRKNRRAYIGRDRMIRIALAASLAMLAPFGASAQTTDQLVKGSTDTSNVLNYGMGYNLQRYSPLTQINKDNAKNLVPVWNYSFADDRSEES